MLKLIQEINDISSLDEAKRVMKDMAIMIMELQSQIADLQSTPITKVKLKA